MPQQWSYWPEMAAKTAPNMPSIGAPDAKTQLLEKAINNSALISTTVSTAAAGKLVYAGYQSKSAFADLAPNATTLGNRLLNLVGVPMPSQPPTGWRSWFSSTPIPPPELPLLGKLWTTAKATGELGWGLYGATTEVSKSFLKGSLWLSGAAIAAGLVVWLGKTAYDAYLAKKTTATPVDKPKDLTSLEQLQESPPQNPAVIEPMDVRFPAAEGVPAELTYPSIVV